MRVWVTFACMNLRMCSVKMRGDRFFAFVKYERGNQGEPRRRVVRAIGRLCDGSQYGCCEYSRNQLYPVGTAPGDRQYLVIPPFTQYQYQYCISHNVLIIQFCTILYNTELELHIL